MPADSSVRTNIGSVLERGAETSLSDDDFNRCALLAFVHQFHHNLPYQRYCLRLNRTPETVTDWLEIPAVPTAAFKEVELVAGRAVDAQLVFRTSGTTRGTDRRGTHYILDTSLYEQSLLAGFRTFVARGHRPMRMLSLVPSHTELPDSSLSYMITTVMRELGAANSDCFASREGIDTKSLDHVLQTCNEPVCLLGTSLAFLHWLADDAVQFNLPAGSRLMDTGGFKGETRSVSAPEMRERYRKQLAIAEPDCINEYGMTELCSQYYDSGDQLYKGPPWLRARVVDPDTLQAVPRGSSGILQHFDLANLDSVCAVLTEDLAHEEETGFVLAGRAAGAMPRGCSIAMDMLLRDAARR
jgi:hypothetical protein